MTEEFQTGRTRGSCVALVVTLLFALPVPAVAGLLLPGPDNEDLDAARRVAYFVERKSTLPGMTRLQPFKKVLADAGFYEDYADALLERLAPRATVFELAEADFKSALAAARAGHFDLLMRLTVDPLLGAEEFGTIVHGAEEFETRNIHVAVEADLKVWRVSDGHTLWLAPEKSSKTFPVKLDRTRVFDDAFLLEAANIVPIFREVARDVARRYDLDRHVGSDYKHAADDNRRFFGPLLEDPRLRGTFRVPGTDKARETAVAVGNVSFAGETPGWRYSVVNGLGHVRVSLVLDLSKPELAAGFEAVKADLASINAECGSDFEWLQDVRPVRAGGAAGRNHGYILVQQVHGKKLKEDQLNAQREWAIANLLRIRRCLVPRFAKQPTEENAAPAR